jgi:nitrogen regulatory protein PII
MKLIIAIIRPYHLEILQPALQRQNVFVTSVSEVISGSHDEGYLLIYRERVINARRPRLRVEMMVDDYQAEDVVEAIRAATVAGCPGNVSDAKIMVLQMEDPKPAPREPVVKRLNGKQLALSV